MTRLRRAALRWGVRLTAVLALLAGTVTVAAADTVDPATAPPVRTITYNVCGAHDCQSDLDLATWTAELRDQTLAWDTDALMLQELCFGQWAALRDALPGYSGVWTSTTTDSDCAKWSPTDTRFGLGVFVKAPAVERYAANLTVPANTEARAVLCARGPVDGRTTLACTTHLAQYIKPDNGSAQAIAKIDTWAAGVPVILGTDLNAGTEPVYDPALDPIRRGGPGTGPFAEADENDREFFTEECVTSGATSCRSGEATVASGRKFDHVFLTAGDFHTVRADALEPESPGTKPLSDHKLLRAAAHPETRAGSGTGGDLTGDGRPDFLAAKDDGSLRLYSGTGGGGVGVQRQIGTGGWADAVISHRGDWTGDGREDVVARIGDALWVYPNTGSGELGTRIAMGGRPTGWTNLTPISAGDVDRDGLPDVVVRSTTGLWLHRGGVAVDGAPTFAPRAAVAIGKGEWAGYDVLVPGDVDRDGRADLWARDRATGAVKEYRSEGAQDLVEVRTLDGGPLTPVDRRLAVTSGDVNGDGTPDVWTTRTAGTAENLEFLPGTPTGLGSPTTVGTGGWQWMKALG
ncbi:VCBS repeat-containing protein [Streptomyces sp. NBC_00572]|uniref:FG-GAP repeat domain-containing protein n=1 Tax=Streptomyces sp. NBC_00572 TaxID=2903664 RepID=UPI00224CC7DB|nr:VCBS repeat-containing protein [Streptomyces sp. NBC_00572]MCX4980925.1 VCBS repeat-containing protein [Streptomyces sp. NBC_00572]